jgi:CAAX protease family protein
MHTFLTSTWQDIRDLPHGLIRDREALSVIVLTLLPWFILIVRKPEAGELVQLGGLIGFVAFYWVICHRQPLKPDPVRRPGIELAVALILVALWILYRIGDYWHWYTPPTFGINACSSLGDGVLLKMIEMVLVPFVFLLALRYSLPQMGFRWSKSAWLIALVPIAALVAYGLSHHSLGQFAASSGCFFLGAGLPEEFLFRGILQTRLEKVLRRPLWALWVASFIFGLAHVPIDLHGSFANWQEALLTAFTFQMSAGVAFGYAYMHTRNLLPISIIHTVLDSAL